MGTQILGQEYGGLPRSPMESMGRAFTPQELKASSMKNVHKTTF